MLVGLTEAYGKIPTRLHGSHLENLEQCVANIGMILASWPGEYSSDHLIKRDDAHSAQGLLYMCMDDCRAIKSLISSLHVPNADMRVSIEKRFADA